MFIFDTDHLSLHQKGYAPIVNRVQSIPDELIYASVVSYEEQLRGWLDVIKRVENTPKISIAYQSLREMQEYFCTITIVDFDTQVEPVYRHLRKTYKRLGSMDLRIAATALVNNAILVTRNKRDFAEIEGLTIEDWSAS